MANTTFVGNIGEQIAADYLKEKGYEILERNVELCGCEVDIICEIYTAKDGTVVKQKKHNKLFNSIVCRFKSIIPSKTDRKDVKKTVVFCEVKTRTGMEFGCGAEAVTKYKVGRYVTAAKSYTVAHNLLSTDVRFDIIEVGDGVVNHIENAFDTCDAKYLRR